MEWEPRFPTVTFGLPLIDNLKRIIERDSAAALNWVHQGEMEPFARVLKAERISRSFPYIALFPRNLNPPLGEWGQPELQTKGVLFEIANIGSDPELLKTDSEERVVAILHVVTTARLDDILLGISHRPEIGLQLSDVSWEELRTVDTAKGKYHQVAWGAWDFRHVEDVEL
jgi:hypothetical protein